ncbi:MAG: TauD/TfdA family dioxygenase [Alphaproteobacteria bacterium]|nr:TauD/TfdA family dioxygenase [Alphaproteobacteria bacterium]
MLAIADAPIAEPSAWLAPEMARDKSWIWTIPEAGVKELEAAMGALKARGLSPELTGRADFPLPSMAGDLRRLAEAIEDGRGFQVIRGIPVDRYSDAELRLLYWGLGLYFGTPVVQTKDDDWFIDVRDESKAYDKNTRGYHSRDRLRFHSDGANIVSLLCINKAKEGGLSSIACSAAIYNEVLANHPDILPILYKGFPHDRRGAEPEGEPRLSPWKLPIFSFPNGRFACVYDRGSAEWGCERWGRPMAAAERAAFDTMDGFANDPRFRVDMDLEPGDIQLLNNFLILHSRTAFLDHDDPARRRHLLRLWITVPESRRSALNKLHLYTRAPIPTDIPIERVA